MRDLPNLDFLRACAVLSVVIEHILLAVHVQRIWRFQVAWAGVVGVFLFFVHTSLVLMWSLERRPHTLDFYVRRVFRIYPLAIVAALAALLFHAPLNGSPDHYFLYSGPPNWHFGVSALLLTSNLHGSWLPLSVFWSLPYEVDMYLFLPAVFFFIQKNFSIYPLLLVWIFLLLLNHSLFPGVAHNFLLTVPYFLPGVMAYVGFSRIKTKLPAWTLVPTLFAVWAVFLLRPSWRGGNLVCLAVGLALPLFRQFRLRGITEASHQVAKYSYGLYISHPFAIVLGIYLMPHAPHLQQVLISLASMTVLSVAAYHLLERPFIRVGSRLAHYAEKRYEQKQLGQFRIAEAEIQ